MTMASRDNIAQRVSEEIRARRLGIGSTREDLRDSYENQRPVVLPMGDGVWRPWPFGDGPNEDFRTWERTACRLVFGERSLEWPADEVDFETRSAMRRVQAATPEEVPALLVLHRLGLYDQFVRLEKCFARSYRQLRQEFSAFRYLEICEELPEAREWKDPRWFHTLIAYREEYPNTSWRVAREETRRQAHLERRGTAWWEKEYPALSKEKALERAVERIKEDLKLRASEARALALHSTSSSYTEMCSRFAKERFGILSSVGDFTGSPWCFSHEQLRRACLADPRKYLPKGKNRVVGLLQAAGMGLPKFFDLPKELVRKLLDAPEAEDLYRLQERAKALRLVWIRALALETARRNRWTITPERTERVVQWSTTRFASLKVAEWFARRAYCDSLYSTRTIHGPLGLSYQVRLINRIDEVRDEDLAGGDNIEDVFARMARRSQRWRLNVERETRLPVWDSFPERPGWQQLLSGAELEDIGGAMDLCCATYGQAILSGRTSAWLCSAVNPLDPVLAEIHCQTANGRYTAQQVQGIRHRSATSAELAEAAAFIAQINAKLFPGRPPRKHS